MFKIMEMSVLRGKQICLKMHFLTKKLHLIRLLFSDLIHVKAVPRDILQGVPKRP